MQFSPTRLVPVNGVGPEDTLIDAEGGVYTGLEDGRILRVSPDGARLEAVADTGGRPLGLEFFGDELLVCDAHRGLLVADPATGAVRTLAAEVAGSPLTFCNNAAVAADGTVYFSDSTTRFPIARWRDEVIERTGTGRLFRRTPDGAIDEVVGGLQFANGVALAPDESFVTVAETSDCRVRRLWLTGERAGVVDLFADDLAGYPDNTSTGSDGLIWVTSASPKVAALGLARKLPASLRAGVRRLPTSLQPSPAPSCGVLGIDASGKVVHDLTGEIGGFHLLTGVRERDGVLYFGSLEGRVLVRTTVP